MLAPDAMTQQLPALDQTANRLCGNAEMTGDLCNREQAGYRRQLLRGHGLRLLSKAMGRLSKAMGSCVLRASVTGAPSLSAWRAATRPRRRASCVSADVTVRTDESSSVTSRAS